MGLFPKCRRPVLTACVIVFVAGLGVRLALVLSAPGPHQVGGEPIGIAQSLATTGRYADAYGTGVGLTAHCAPLHPLLLSVLFRIFGPGEHAALAVNVFASVAAALAFAFLPALAVASRLPLFTGVLAGIGGALLPVNYWPQTSGVFDAPFTCVALTVLCWLLCLTSTAGRFAKYDGFVFGIAAGLACLLNPVMIPVLVAWFVVCVVRHRQQLRRVLWFFAITALCVISFLAPWAARNYVALGSAIWTRSNFGLELQVSNNDITTADLERNVRLPEFGLLHPFIGEGERQKVRAMGEVAYQRQKKTEAIAWITAHKERFLVLTAERFRLFWLPGMRRVWQSAIEAALTVLGLAGLALLFWKGYDLAWIASAALIAYSAVYYIIQVSPRYRFPLEPILFLLSAHCLLSVIAMARRGREPRESYGAV